MSIGYAKRVWIVWYHWHVLINITFFPDKVDRATLGNPVTVDADGLLMDVDVQAIDDNLPTCEDKWQDVDHFFRIAVAKDVNGKSKKYRACKLCPWVFSCIIFSCAHHHWQGTSRNNKSLVDEITTLRRHLEASHSVSETSTILLFLNISSC